jgi:hypothetical protein|tara:strand:- start:257 stop:424 length:168 start_codon:yes stop_codon:yes gene_type:complete
MSAFASNYDGIPGGAGALSPVTKPIESTFIGVSIKPASSSTHHSSFTNSLSQTGT